jgi:hypothetical protein
VFSLIVCVRELRSLMWPPSPDLRFKATAAPKFVAAPWVSIG